MSVQYQIQDEVALITLHRPDRFNAVSADLSEKLIAGLKRAAGEARALVLTGSGKAFCAGADLADLMSDYETGGPDLHRVIEQRFNPMGRALLEAPLPTIAAINGVAAGAGMGLALACDLRVMSTEAYFLSAFIGLALIPDTGSTWLLVHHLGLSRALEFTASNRRMPASEAANLGITHQLAEPDQVTETALAYARQLADGPTTAYAANRQIFYQSAATDFSSALDGERDLQGELGRTPAHLEGMRAFLEKRPPNYRNPG
ncbi:MAG TPA: enoyl-CoA hydratase-related protein [Acidimicrobiia bacterium]|nr:enoyl-CoA hydratase-related protein [Acidimicrobiia bacterium]